ncbi:hypothetical protein [Stakelama flava]|uniref:hypothetical protein n=1 Tax=Stakelama flava TaxID=2860338 RepID=UPI001FE2A5F5|nr:hypothetical protein [Stakelama flava]
MLYDAVAVIASEDRAKLIATNAAAKDFVSGTFAHCHFIGLSEETRPLMEKAGLADDLNDGCLALETKADAKRFVETLAPPHFWDREPMVDLDAHPEYASKGDEDGRDTGQARTGTARRCGPLEKDVKPTTVGLPSEPLEKLPIVGTVRPKDYPEETRAKGDPDG